MKALKCKPSALTTAHAQVKRIYRRGHVHGTREQLEYTFISSSAELAFLTSKEAWIFTNTR